jgi:hypothetical protein
MPADNAVDSFIVTPAKGCVKKWKSLSFVMAGLDLGLDPAIQQGKLKYL